MPGIGIGPNAVFLAGGKPKLPVMTGNILWLRADLGITPNGSNVAGWADQSGAGNDAVQGTAADQPAFSAAGGPNGRPAVVFDETNVEHMDLTGMTDASNDYTVFAVLDQASDTAATIQTLFMAAASDMLGAHLGSVSIYDGAWRDAVAEKTGEQILAWRLDSTGTALEVYRDGVLLGSDTYDGTWGWDAAATLGIWTDGASNPLDAKLSELIIYNRKLTDAEVAQVHAYLALRYALSFSPLSVANCGAWWDMDNATVAGGILTAVTDRALAQTINVVGSPAVVSVGSQDFVRFDGTDDVLWIADAAALDGATGTTFVMKHANTESLPAIVDFCSKSRLAVHGNGGLLGNSSAGTRFDVRGGSIVADAGPLAEFTSPAETVAMAFESGAAIRRVDGDGTYASTVTAINTTVGVGSLSWGALDTGAGPTFGRHAQIDIRAAAYYSRPLPQLELEAVRDFLEDA